MLDSEHIFNLECYWIKNTCSNPIPHSLNNKNYKVGDYQLILHQYLQTNMIMIVCQTVKRIANEILEV